MLGWSFMSEVTGGKFRYSDQGHTLIIDSLKWFAQTLRVLSRRITTRTFLVSLFCNSRTSPVPRSFHSFDSVTKRKSFARLHVSELLVHGRYGREGIARTS